MNFFVIGLPRSRTAWLANFLTHEKHCFHEGLDDCYNIDQYRQKLGRNHGDSSTGLMLLDMNKEFPDAPKVIIEGRVKEAIDYGYKTYGHYNPDYIDHLNQRMHRIEGMRVQFDDIDKKLPEIWQHLIGTPYDEKRGELLQRMKIEVKDPFDYNVESVKALCNSLN